MDNTTAIELLQTQIAEANNGRPADFESWKRKTATVLRMAFGEGTQHLKDFDGLRFGPGVWFSGMPDTAFDSAREEDVRSVMAILEAAVFELEHSGSSSEKKNDGDWAVKGIFIVHGHDNATKHEVARVVQRLTGEEATILHEQASEGRTLIEKFEAHAAGKAFAVIIMTADDVGRAKAAREDNHRGRQNVVFEFGFFVGALGRRRVALLHEEGVELPSDLHGLVYIPLDSGGGWHAKLGKELLAAGIDVDLNRLK
jgi:predicted nucleotide-binding protein